MIDVVLATGNQSKVAEMQNVLNEFGFNVIPQSKYNFIEAVEDGLSFVENALIKARHACEHTGLAAIADDSGLEVDALDGEPGIYSARYAEEPDFDQFNDRSSANNHKLLTKLSGVTNRTARFQCVLVFMQHAKDPTPIICQGSWEGHISSQPSGDNGFGYDPVFFVPDKKCTAAELSSEQKQQLSHRGHALAHLRRKLSSN